MAPRSEWPGLPASLPDDALQFERGVYGKAHGVATDFRWLARTDVFPADDDTLEQSMGLGPLDDGFERRAVHWSALSGGRYLAHASYPSRSRDAANRPCPIERHALHWKARPDVPPALAALLLLPWSADCPGEDLWWRHRKKKEWADPEFLLQLRAEDSAPLSFDERELASVIERGLRSLARTLGRDKLVAFYAKALSSDAGKPAVISGLGEPLSPAAMACLLLPLPPDRAGSLSIAGWLYSRRVSMADLGRYWDVIFCGKEPLEGAGFESERSELAEACAQAVLDGEPGQLRSLFEEEERGGTVKGGSLSGPLEVAMWGPSSSGKTMLLAQMLLRSTYKTHNWMVYPTKQAEGFAQVMYQAINSEHRFPKPTPADNPQSVLYTFRHEAKDLSIDLYVEDRAGKRWEELDEESRARLLNASGLVLLFDPTREPKAFRQEVFKTLTTLFVARDGAGTQRDERPVAVCLSKADEIIENAAGLRKATNAVDRGEFAAAWLRNNGHGAVIDRLEHFLGNYQLFPVSSVGACLRHGVVEPAVFYDEQLLPRIVPNGEPINLMAPFEWIFEVLEERDVLCA